MAKRISEKLLTKSPATNKGLAKAGLMYFVSTFVLYLKLVLRIEHCAKMPCLRQAPNRYTQPMGGTANPTFVQETNNSNYNEK